MFQPGDACAYFVLSQPEQFLIHLCFRLELLINDQALRDRLLSQPVAGFTQAVEIAPQRIDFIQQSRMHGFGKPTFGLVRIGNAERADERL